MFKGNSKLKNIFLLGFLLSLHLALVSYVNSSFLTTFSGENSVSLIYIIGSAAALFVLFYIPGILQKLGEYKFLLWSSGLNALTLLLLSILKSPLGIIPVFILYFTLNYLMVFALDELLQIFSKNSSMGQVRGLYLTIINLAWVISQAVSGETLSGFSYSALYFVAFMITGIFFLVVFLGLKDISDPKYDKVVALQSYKNFFKNKNLIRAYFLNFLLQFFYASMVIYTPIYLYSHLGFDWKQIGIIFTIMLLPFVIIQFPLGKYSDKVGERKMLAIGFLITSIATISLFFIKNNELWIWATLLFSTRVGAAIIEVMSDIYFFKHITSENDEFIAVYRNTAPLSYLLAPLVALVIFMVTPSFNYIFLILGILMLCGTYLSLSIKKDDI
ncbi:MAG: MFS transporter [bacterium]